MTKSKKKKKLMKQLWVATEEAVKKFDKATEKGDLNKASYYLSAIHAYSTAANVASKSPKNWSDSSNGDNN